MSYKALYRIYRPASFDEVSGQKHITQTLRNALKNNRVAHAYLFSGPRGTGKTSIAKILAKAINCVEAPTDNPCNKCENCIGITNNTISDVIEIDAASNNGVDEIRELRDKVKYLPGYVKYKVYIIDEVHMLSTGAFNALLKTLEEPPQHVIFILCTTEPQKIPATIHSRCQRFDFKAISNADIIDKIFEIAEKENIGISEEAVKQIANYSEGGLRDAISLLDQVHAYNPQTIGLDDVNEICGTVSFNTLINLVESLVERKPANAIDLLNNLISEGKESKKITLDLIDFFKNLLMYKSLKSFNDVTVFEDSEEFKLIANKVNNKRLFNILKILNDALNDINWSGDPKTYLELAFLKITDKEKALDEKIDEHIQDLEERINYLESNQNTFDNKNKEDKNTLEKVNEVEAVKTEKLNTEKTDFEEEIIESKEDVNTKETKETKENEDVKEVVSTNSEKSQIEAEICDDISNTYNISFVEEVLNNGDRNDKLYLLDEWQGFERGITNKDEKYLASLLETGKVVASKKNKIIIAFSSATICNKLMVPDNKEIIQRILYDKFQRDIDYMALPVEVFEDITKEFMELYNKGETDIKLTKIYCDGLKDVSKVKKDDKRNEESKVVTDAKNIFGDLVKVKK
ncbi:MAG: DNA polymerase III subunit gamma/tau [Candidatus Izemoplasmatales bacterium]